MKIGLISDTHDFLDPKAVELFAGVNYILHAGDIGRDAIISELEEIAPVKVVRGNTDHFSSASPTEIIAIGGRKFFIHHDVNPRALKEELKLRIARERLDVVVFGHTHRRFNETIDGVLYVNPGYAGKPKFNTERSVAILHCDEKEIRTEYLPL